MSVKKKQHEWVDITDDLVELISADDHEKNINLELLLSPQNAPKVIRGDMKPSIQEFVIRFRYIVNTDEEIIQDALNQHAKFFIGSKSGKIYQIELDVKELRASNKNFDSIVDEAEELIKKYLKQLAEKNDSIGFEKSDILSTLIERHKKDIFADLLTA